MIAGVPYWRLSGFYFFYFAVLGAMVPYWPVYLKEIGFGPQQIGILTAIVMATKIVAPNIWGWLADHTGKRMRIIRFGSLVAFITFGAIFYKQTFGWFVLVICVYSFFWNAVLSQFEVVTLDHLKDRPQIYSRVRLWGSIGFIVAVAVLGVLFDYVTINLLPMFLLVSLALIWASSLLVKEAPVHIEREAGASIWNVITRPAVISLFAVCFLMQVSHGPYYTFFSLYMEGHGYSRTHIGELWALGTFAEVVLFWYMHSLMPKFGIRFIIMLSLAATTLRWLLIAWYPENLPVILFAQLLHAFSFGSFHAATIELVRQFFTQQHAGRGQALYSSLSFGAGSALGALMSGYLWVWSEQWTFVIASGVSFLALLIAWVGISTAEQAD